MFRIKYTKYGKKSPAILRVSFRLLNNVGADAHIGPLIRPQIDRGRVWAPAPTALQ